MLRKPQRIDRPLFFSVTLLVMFVFISHAYAQLPATQKLSMLRTQNSYQQQQAALQLAIQQTNLLTQRATRRDTSIEPAGFFAPLDFGPQQAALQFAFQQSTMTLPSISATRG